MITEALLGIGITVAAYRRNHLEDIEKKKKAKNDEREFRNKWNLTMKYNGVKNKNEQTFEILKYIPKNYGCDCIVGIPLGLDYSNFKKLITALQNTYSAQIVSTVSKNSVYVRIYKDIDDINPKDLIRLKWYKAMDSDNKLSNQELETYTIEKITEKELYGYDLLLNIPTGLDYKTLENFKDKIETTFKGKIYQRPLEFNNQIEMSIVTKEMPDDYKFEPNQTGVNTLYLGMTYDYRPIYVDLKVLSHMMYSGMPNTGKTVCLLTALTNHIYWHDESKWDLYLAMISAKKDLKIFANTKQCKYFADNLEKALLLFMHLQHIKDERNKIFNSIKDDYIMNIYDWNKKFPMRKMKTIIVATDEISFFMPDSLDNEITAKIKNQCLDLLFMLYKEARNCGIHILSCLQRPDRENFKATMKALIGAKVCFHQPNDASSLVVLDDNSATKLRKQREAIVETDERYLMKTLYLDVEMIKNYISKRIEPNHKHLNLDGYAKKAENNNPKTEEQKKTNNNNNQNTKQSQHKIDLRSDKNANKKRQGNV